MARSSARARVRQPAHARRSLRFVVIGAGMSGIRCGKAVTRCAVERGRWRIATADGDRDEADFVIAATGVLHHPRYPDIEGLDRFAGPCFHSARWDHGVPLAGRRLGISDGFYAAIQHPTATLLTEPIERIEPAGSRTRDGTRHALDVLVLATGFHVDAFVRPMTVLGRGGVPLEDVWADGPYAYLAIGLPDFPNFVMLNGPNGPVGNFSLIEVAELQMGYVLQLADALRAGACDEASPTPAAMARFDAERRRAAAKTIWATGCRSWYLDRSGLPTARPFTWDRFRDEMRRPRLEDWDLRRTATEPR